MKLPTPMYGLMAEFVTPEQVLTATRSAHQRGYRQMDAYSPYPVEGLSEALGMRHSKIPRLVLTGGLIGAAVGFAMQYYSMAIDYPLNSGGRPYNSWPAYVPIAFEVLVLVASLSAVLGVFYLSGLPRPYHPVFNVPAFARASQDRFFLCIEAIDPLFDVTTTGQFLAALNPQGPVIEVPH